MGNTGSRRVHGRRRSSSGLSHPPPAPVTQPEIGENSYVFAAPQPPSQYPNLNIPPLVDMPVPMPAAPTANWVNGRYSSGVTMQPSQPHVEHQKAITIRNDVNLKKETLRIEPDEANPGKFLVEFTFDATVTGSITTVFFAKEGEDRHLIPTKESLLPPITVHFQPGLDQKFKQPSGTGIDISMLNEAELLNNNDNDMYPLAVKAEASPDNLVENPVGGSINSQITRAVIRKEKGEYLVRVVKQVLWVNGTNYELQEIYGIGNSVENDFDGNDPGKECVICLLEPRDTTVLPCRHMCMCSSCAKVLRIRTNKCPICRQTFERLLEIKLTDETKE